MQFVPLDNFYQMLKSQAGVSNVPFTDTTGTSRTFGNASVTAKVTHIAKMPFNVETDGQNITAATTGLPYCTASSAASIPSNIYAVPDPVGSATVSYSRNASGWTATISIVGNATASITHLIFNRLLSTGTSTSYDALMWAVKLDTPVELNESNNYTANFTFAIEF